MPNRQPLQPGFPLLEGGFDHLVVRVCAFKASCPGVDASAWRTVVVVSASATGASAVVAEKTASVSLVVVKHGCQAPPLRPEHKSQLNNVLQLEHSGQRWARSSARFGAKLAPSRRARGSGRRRPGVGVLGARGRVQRDERRRRKKRSSEIPPPNTLGQLPMRRGDYAKI